MQCRKLWLRNFIDNNSLSDRFGTEYIWNYYFYQDGSIELEIRLTGVLQVYVADENEPNPFGSTVAPRINAHIHQHLFSIRVDPMIDGLHNTVIESDVVPLPNAPVGSKMNFSGNAFIVQEKMIKSQSEGAREYEWEKSRVWRIVNPERKHYSTGKSAGYTIDVKGGAQTLLSKEDSWPKERAAFSTKTVWVVKDVEDEKGGRFWPAGKYVTQTRTESEDSISKWIQNETSVENEDILVFATIGL
jgi:primary-amine oxidase